MKPVFNGPVPLYAFGELRCLALQVADVITHLPVGSLFPAAPAGDFQERVERGPSCGRLSLGLIYFHLPVLAAPFVPPAALAYIYRTAGASELNLLQQMALVGLHFYHVVALAVHNALYRFFGHAWHRP